MIDTMRPFAESILPFTNRLLLPGLSQRQITVLKQTISDILKKAGVKPIVLSTSLDFSMLYELRNKMPCLDHKRL